MKKVKIGTHNSLSYLKPLHIWFRPFQFIAKCQTLNIEQQILAGAEYLDVRLAIINGVMYPAHGYVLYNPKGYRELLMALEVFKYKGVVRITWEDTVKGAFDSEDMFISQCETLEKRYPNIKFTGGCKKSTWENVYKFKHTEPPLNEKYSSYSCKWLSWFPWLYAKLYNTKNLAQNNNNSITVIDFL